jgi:hypothetical protein
MSFLFSYFLFFYGLTWQVGSGGVVLGLLEYTPMEFANNLSHIEWGMWVRIRESELIGLGWTKKNKDEIAPNGMPTRLCDMLYFRSLFL